MTENTKRETKETKIATKFAEIFDHNNTVQPCNTKS
jgi:hypothetical protein